MLQVVLTTGNNLFAYLRSLHTYNHAYHLLYHLKFVLTCASLVSLADQGDRDPYWCRLWPSAIALAQLILQQPELVRGKRVCDIGCGLGLAGIAAALAGLPFHFPSSFPFGSSFQPSLSRVSLITHVSIACLFEVF